MKETIAQVRKRWGEGVCVLEAIIDKPQSRIKISPLLERQPPYIVQNLVDFGEGKFGHVASEGLNK